MIKLIARVAGFIVSDFNFTQYGSIVIFITSLIGINYLVKPIEMEMINGLPGGPLRFLGYLALYSLTYFAALLISLLVKQKTFLLRDLKVWLLPLSGIIIFSLDAGLFLPQYFLNRTNHDASVYSFYFSLISNGKGLITISLILLFVNFKFIINRNEFLGLNRETNLKPFFVALILISPLIYISTLDAGLNSYYPTFKYPTVYHEWSSPKWVPAFIYEIIYGADFFNVELFFRGFMVIGLSAVLGKESILPMAAFYCSIHFGKPLAECISSFFGGYILGIIAFETRSILGGIILHIGVAWLMELSSFLNR